MGDELAFGEWLEDAYREHFATQGAFADAIGVAQSTVSGWVNGPSTPRNRRVLRRISDVLNVDIDELNRRAGIKARDEKAEAAVKAMVAAEQLLVMRDMLTKSQGALDEAMSVLEWLMEANGVNELPWLNDPAPKKKK